PSRRSRRRAPRDRRRRRRRAGRGRSAPRDATAPCTPASCRGRRAPARPSAGGAGRARGCRGAAGRSCWPSRWGTAARSAARRRPAEPRPGAAGARPRAAASRDPRRDGRVRVRERCRRTSDGEYNPGRGRPRMTPPATRKVPTYCYQCVAGPDLLNVVVEDGVAVKVEPNFGVTEHPAGGRPCVRAYSLVQKLYNPNRVKGPMKRTNPRKGKDENPGWQPISWDEALDTLADKLRPIREGGFVDEHGYPRLAVTFGAGGTAPAYLGGFPAFLSAWGGPLDQGIGSGQGMKCVHSEHLYGEFWHRAFTVAPDMPHTTYVLSFGNNGDVSGGVIGVWRHAEARGRGARWIQFEPHMSVTAATAARWVPIKPKTDPAVLFAILHGVLHEHDWRRVCDVDYLGRMTNAPYLVGPNGYYLREASSRKPLVWDEKRGAAVPFDAPDVEAYALDGEFTVERVGLDVGRVERHGGAAFLVPHERLARGRLAQVVAVGPDEVGRVGHAPEVVDVADAPPVVLVQNAVEDREQHGRIGLGLDGHPASRGRRGHRHVRLELD